jgi:hypothetical protein
MFWDFTGWDLMPQNEGLMADNALLTPHCIHHLTPQAKLILILRNPVDRQVSNLCSRNKNINDFYWPL